MERFPVPHPTAAPIFPEPCAGSSLQGLRVAPAVLFGFSANQLFTKFGGDWYVLFKEGGVVNQPLSLLVLNPMRFWGFGLSCFTISSSR
jgi:hypothetical protein